MRFLSALRPAALLPRLLRRLFGAALLASLPLVPAAAWAACNGQNLFASLSPADRATLDAATEAQPFATGNLWLASKGDDRLWLLGTYHLADPRHDAVIAAVEPLIEDVTVLLVEAGPEEEAALKRDIAKDPGLLFLTEGPSLMEQMPAEDWQRVRTAVAARNIPGVMAAKMQPWYLATMLAIPPCAMQEVAKGKGLDHQVMEMAKARDLSVRALEPHTTLFAIFDSLSAEDQLAMLRSTLLMEDQVADFSATLADAYFAEDSRRVWEYMRLMTARMPGYTQTSADAELARMEEVLITRRNAGWIPRLEAAAAEGPALAAFGALHLPGQGGVLAMLAERGWTVERLPLGN
ncbi:TraB/GumN family protein [Gemmobacter denitrificans]|uniref:TraB/GumN family protein n=1 Tax=Gemmobacter denitrificans TaxID=3123040 RepID=A0ABU8BUM4_9RHOB